MLVVNFKKVNSNDHKATINFVHPFRDFSYYLQLLGLHVGMTEVILRFCACVVLNQIDLNKMLRRQKKVHPQHSIYIHNYDERRQRQRDQIV